MNFDIKDFQNPSIKDFAEYKEMYERSINEPDKFFLEQANKHISWFQRPTKGSSGSFEKPAWFEDGKLNISYNCIDRHCESRPNDTAIIWQGDDKDSSNKISFSELLAEVSRLANALKKIY